MTRSPWRGEGREALTQAGKGFFRLAALRPEGPPPSRSLPPPPLFAQGEQSYDPLSLGVSGCGGQIGSRSHYR